MTFLKFKRGLTYGALAAGLTLTSVMAQNGTNYHILVNTTETIFGGIGAGGTQTATDGLMTVIPGEDLKGSHTVAFSGDFGYRNSQFREMLCVLNFPVGGGPLALQFAGLVFVEMDGLNGNVPVNFTNPACAAPSFPLGGTAGFIPYGLSPGASASFLLSLLPTGSGLPSSTVVLLPNNGLVPSVGGTATLIAAAAATLPINSTGFCWGVQFTWIPSALTSLDDVDSWVHYVVNSPDGNQYWLMSDDELNIWQSWSVLVDAGATAIQGFFANDDYGLLMATVEPSTSASLAPTGNAAAGVYYAQTENVVNEFGAPALNPNGGMDVGRGSRAISLKGHAGVPNQSVTPTGLGNQEPTLTGALPTLGLLTWDNGGDFNGSVRLPWLSIDTAGLLGLNPATDPGIVKPFFGVRLPVVSAGFVQPLTSLCWNLFGHKTSTAVSTWPDPEGFPATAFGGISAIGGASAQFPTNTLTVCNVPGILGVPVNLTYGTTGRKDGPGGLTFNPSIADLSDSRELFLFD